MRAPLVRTLGIASTAAVLLTLLTQLVAQPPEGRQGRGRGNPFGDVEISEERLNPEDLTPEDGAASIPDWETFDRFSYTGPEVMIDTHLAHQQFVKFQIERVNTDEPQLYFINTKTHRAHPRFMMRIGLMKGGMRGMRGDGSSMRGVLIFHPNKKSPNGQAGLFTYEFEPNDRYAFDKIQLSNEMLIAKMPMLQNRVGYFPMPAGVPQAKEDQELYDDSDVLVFYAEDIEGNIGYLPLNETESYGRLRLMKTGESLTSRDIVLCTTLPNEMPRVAGIVSAVRQTPLSHVNLRAVQDGVPNAYIAGADDNAQIKDLLGHFVYYRVDSDQYEIRRASDAEVEAHFASIRPRENQIPVRDLSVKMVRPLAEITFEDSKSVGVKAANVAVMQTFGFPDGTIPDGFAVPFAFYDEFMKHSGLYDAAKEMLEDKEFLSGGPAGQQKLLKSFRESIKSASMPTWMEQALDETHSAWPEGTSLRCRSSTNNEDLPGFSGAGLYGSCTHHPHEGHLSKSVKQVFASLWNYRAFEERDFYRIDHFAAAMGVLIHPNYSGELANGVAVTEDILYGTQGNHFLNTQVGEDLVTNPEGESIPEETLLDWSDAKKTKIMRSSNRNTTDEPLLSPEHLAKLRICLGKIHSRFAKLYGMQLQDKHFAMEIEYKIKADGKLAIKQARPWVFSTKKE